MADHRADRASGAVFDRQVRRWVADHRSRRNGDRVVTAIEVLSPANKDGRPGDEPCSTGAKVLRLHSAGPGEPRRDRPDPVGRGTGSPVPARGTRRGAGLVELTGHVRTTPGLRTGGDAGSTGRPTPMPLRDPVADRRRCRCRVGRRGTCRWTLQAGDRPGVSSRAGITDMDYAVRSRPRPCPTGDSEWAAGLANDRLGVTERIDCPIVHFAVPGRCGWHRTAGCPSR